MPKQKDNFETISTKSEDEIVKMVADRASASEREMQDYIELFKRCYDAVYQVVKTGNMPHKAKITDPEAMAIIKNMLPRTIARTLDVEVRPQGMDDAGKDVVVETILRYQYRNSKRKVPMSYIWEQFESERLITGGAWLKIFWETRDRVVGEKSPLLKLGSYEFGSKEKKKLKIEFDSPSAEWKPVEDILFDPMAKSLNDCLYIIERSYQTLEDLKRENEAYKNKFGIDLYNNLGGLKELKSATFSGGDLDSYRNNSLSILGNNKKQYEDSKYKFEVLRYWEDNRVLTVVNRQVLIRDAKNPYNHGKKPFVYCPNIVSTKRFYGIGEIEPILRQLNAINDLDCHAMDMINQTIDPVLVIPTTAEVDEDTFIMSPYAVIRSDTPVQTLAPQGNPRYLYEAKEQKKMSTDNFSGMSGYMNAVPSASNDQTRGTKGGTLAIINEGSQQFALKIQHLEDFAFRPMLEMWHSMNQQFLTDDDVFKITGFSRGLAEKSVAERMFNAGNSDPDIFQKETELELERNRYPRGECEIVINMNKMMPGTKYQEIQQKIEMMNAVMQYLPVLQSQGKTINIEKEIVSILEQAGQPIPVDLIIPFQPPQPVMQPEMQGQGMGGEQIMPQNGSIR